MKSPNFEDALRNLPIEKKWLEDKIAFLRQCWVSEENLRLIAWASEENREHLLSVLWDEPSSVEVDVANNYLDLTRYQIETHTKDRVSRLVMNAANDNIEWLSLRTYWWTWVQSQEQGAA